MDLHKNCQYWNWEIDCWFAQDSHKNCPLSNLDYHSHYSDSLDFQDIGSNHLGIHNRHNVALELKILKI